MGIDFSADRWDKVIKTYQDFWDGNLQRPIIPVVLNGKEPTRPKPQTPLLHCSTSEDLSIPVEDIIDRIDYELSCNEYLGDAFPMLNLHSFGPGVIAAFLGAELHSTPDTVWFKPKEDLPIADLHFEFDPESIWFQRVRDICIAAANRWQGQVLVAMTDLGGNLDILSTFRPSEKLLLDLYDSPDEVKRLTWEAHDCWHKYYNALNEVLGQPNPGYSSWAGLITAEKNHYMLQCDFCYMIGPEMFDEFVKPELQATCQKLDYSFYHLDGIGQLPHLDSLLQIEELHGVQWVPGTGQPDCDKWPEVYKKIYHAGKRIQIISGGFDAIDAVIEQTGPDAQIQYVGFGDNIDKIDHYKTKLPGYGIE